MKLAGLLPAALADRAPCPHRRTGRPAARRAVDVTAPPALRPFVVAAIAKHRPVLAVTATGREADDLADALGCLVESGSVVVYPSWETLPHERLSPRSDTVGRRLAVLRRLAHPGPDGPRAW
jgi:transcription-repair coupling factor (superfamily II helicase)